MNIHELKHQNNAHAQYTCTHKFVTHAHMHAQYRCNRRNVKRFVTPQSYEMVNKMVHPTMEVDFAEEAQYATISGEPARQGMPI